MTVIVKEYDTQYAICKALGMKYNDVDFYASHDIQDNKMIKETSEGTFICESFENNIECRSHHDECNLEHAVYMKVTKVVGDDWVGK